MDVNLEGDWKSKMGFPINYNSGQSSDDDFDTKDVVMRNPRASSILLADRGDGAEADLLGTTPPRSRIRDKEKRRNLLDSGASVQRLLRDGRDVVDRAASPDSASERLRKRGSLKVIRAKERDFKLNMDQGKADSLPSPRPPAADGAAPSVPVLHSQVESASRFMCLSSKPKCRAAGPQTETQAERSRRSERDDQLPANRVHFHKTFSMLINMGNIDKTCRRTISREEQVWQNELKDLIWLELQARLAGRSLAAQDAWLCAQRQLVPLTLARICEYRFVNKNPCRAQAKRADDTNKSHEDLTAGRVEDDERAADPGCLRLDCQACADGVGRAMREVGALVDAFYGAVSLYPSSTAMTHDLPLVATPLFNNRLKAMCQWFNTALNLRLKMLTIQRFLRAQAARARRRRAASEPAAAANLTRQSSEVRQPGTVRFDVPEPSPSPSVSNDSESSYDKSQKHTSQGAENRGDEKKNEEENIHALEHTENREEEKEKEHGHALEHKENREEGTEALEEVIEGTEALEEVIKGKETLERKVCEDDKGVNTEDSSVNDSRKQEDEVEVDSGVDLSHKSSDTSPPDGGAADGYCAADSDAGYTSDASSAPYDAYDIACINELTHLVVLNKTDVSMFREHHQEITKTQGVRRCMTFMSKMRRNIVYKVVHTLERPDTETSPPSMDEGLAEVFHEPRDEDRPDPAKELLRNELRRYGCWSEECISMRLPSYRSHFLLLFSISMEAVHDYLSLRLEIKPERPSCLTVKQLMHELRDGLDIAAEMRADFVRNVQAALVGRSAGAAAADLLLLLRTFDRTVGTMLEVYLSYLTTTSETEPLRRGLLQAEWSFVARLARRLRAAHRLAPRTFAKIACNQLDRLHKLFKDKFNDMVGGDPSNIDNDRRTVYTLCRDGQYIFASEREHTLHAAQWARALAARLARAPPPAYVTQRQDIFNSLMRLRDFIVKQVEYILAKSRALSWEAGDPVVTRVRELILQICKLGFELHRELYKFLWSPVPEGGRRPASLQEPRAPPPPRRARPGTVVLAGAARDEIHKELHRFVGSGSAAGPSGAGGPRGLARLDSVLDDADGDADGLQHFHEPRPQSSIELLLSGAAPPEEAPPGVAGPGAAAGPPPECEWARRVARGVVSFAKCWMNFVVERCDRGRGLRPRWASQGLEFLMLACDPWNTKHLTETEFEELKQLMDGCISHVIGSRPTPDPCAASPRPRHRLHSPLPNSCGGKEVATPPTPPPSEPDPVLVYPGTEQTSHSARVSRAVAALDARRDAALRAARRVGREVAAAEREDAPRLRQLTFKWQRGLKIGAGSFGKVYTVVNTESGQLLAMKEISVGADRRARQRAADELALLEGVRHPHLVRHYGCELHREELLIFMELCVEGSLSALLGAAGALAEGTVRRYARQLLAAVRALHAKGIVHRDIKSGNIFLTNEGHCLKLGDFGCAVKIRANTTAPNELQGFVGTQAYMAPEVFMKSSGHGRAADIWSVGCVVTEMASGKRPFSEYDSNYQIMFMVGMGSRPAAPASLSEEGRQFCALCLAHEPAQRPRAGQLLLHTFLMVKEAEDDCNCEAGVLLANNS